MRTPALTLFAASFAASLASFALPAAAAPTPITLDQAMSHPDWIGTPVEDAWFSWDSKQVYYKQKRTGSPLRDTFQAGANAGKAQMVSDADLPKIDSADVVYNRNNTRMLVIRNNDLFERDLKSAPAGAGHARREPHRQRRSTRPTSARCSTASAPTGMCGTASPASPARPRCRARRRTRTRRKTTPTARPQLRLIDHLKRQKDDRDALRARNDELRRVDATRWRRRPSTWATRSRIGGKFAVAGRPLAAGRHRRQERRQGPRRQDAALRDRIGLRRDPKTCARAWAATCRRRTRSNWSTCAPIPSRTSPSTPCPASPSIRWPRCAPPPRRIRSRATAPVRRLGRRATRSTGAATAPTWPCMLRSVDNKDRWIASVDLRDAKLKPLHRVTDGAWVNYDNNEFGWLPDNRTLWYLSEEIGLLAPVHAGRMGSAAPRALTSGKWEASDVRWNADGSTAYMLCNREAPGDYEVCAVERQGRRGARSDRSSTASNASTCRRTSSKLLVHWSSSYTPIAAGDRARRGRRRHQADRHPHAPTSRRASGSSRRYVRRAIERTAPTRSGPSCIARRTLEAGKNYPVVMFVHGAGYLQNVSKRYPVYFREQMFHNLLVQQGYIVLDMDYRASKGYGAQLAHRDLPPDGPPGTGRLPRRRELAGRPAAGRREQCRRVRRQLRRLHDLHGADARTGRVQGRRRAAPGDRLDQLQPRVHGQHPQHAGHRSGGVQEIVADRVRARTSRATC